MKKFKDVSFNKSRFISIFIGILIFLLAIGILCIKLKYSFFVSILLGIVVGAVTYSIIFSIFDGPTKNVYRKRLKNSIVYQNSPTEVECKSIKLNPYKEYEEHFGNCIFYALLLTNNKVYISIHAQEEDKRYTEWAYEIIDISKFYQYFSFI